MTGTPRPRIVVADDVPHQDWSEEVRGMPGVWPFLGSPWLAGTTKALATAARPMHAVATRGPGEQAWLPGFVFESPPAVDWDPRTYLGWEGCSGQQVCCGVQTAPQATAVVDTWAPESLFPTLVIGSPLGYRSEPAYNFWSPGLFAGLTDRLFEAAADQGVRSIIAPWIPDRRGNEEILEMFGRRGGSRAYWGLEDRLDLTTADYLTHVQELPRKMRQRVRGDQMALARSQLRITRVTGAELNPHVDRIADLVCMNREKNGAEQEPGQVTSILHALIEAGTDLWGYLGWLDDTVVAASVALRKQRRVFVKWAGFDYAVLGERSGLYFSFAFDLPLRDAYAAGAKHMEVGAGAHQAKTLRGAVSRTMHTGWWTADQSIRADAHRLLAEFGTRRRAAFDTNPSESAPPAPTTSLPLPLAPLTSASSPDACCGGPS